MVNELIVRSKAHANWLMKTKLQNYETTKLQKTTHENKRQI